MLSFLLLIIFGKTLVRFREIVLLAILVSTIYKVPFHKSATIMITKLNEKMIISKDAKIESIIIAKRDMGNLHIIAPLRIFLYTSYFFIGYAFLNLYEAYTMIPMR